MSIRVELYFKSSPSLELLEKGILVDIVRLYCMVRLGTNEEDIHEAIVDTGSPVSVLPRSLWSRLDIGKSTSYKTPGSDQANLLIFKQYPPKNRCFETLNGCFQG
jgi:hypothetical protein